MSYATQQDLEDRGLTKELILLTDTTNSPPTTIAAQTVSDALDDADSEINSYIAAKVTTPADPVPRILVTQAVAIARYRLWKDRASEKVQTDYTNAIAWLKAVALGTVALGDSAAPTAPPSQGAPQFEEGPKFFDCEKLRGY